MYHINLLELGLYNHNYIGCMKRILFLCMLIISFSCSAYTQQSQKMIYNNDFVSKFDSIQIGNSPAQVKLILGNPYKRAFAQYKDGNIVEQLSYKTLTEHPYLAWTEIIYKFSFLNSKLIAVENNEYLGRTNTQLVVDEGGISQFMTQVLPFIQLDDNTKQSSSCCCKDCTTSPSTKP